MIGNALFQRVLHTSNSKATLLIRSMVGVVFLSEGIQKFLFPAIRAAGRFEKIGLPLPDLLGPLVGGFEVVCGILICLGLLTRPASMATCIIMLVALATTKLQILSNDGFWLMMHASRTDWAMFLGSLFLILKGGGAFSVDRSISKKWK